MTKQRLNILVVEDDAALRDALAFTWSRRDIAPWRWTVGRRRCSSSASMPCTWW